jgi:hypothetical protein
LLFGHTSFVVACMGCRCVDGQVCERSSRAFFACSFHLFFDIARFSVVLACLLNRFS